MDWLSHVVPGHAPDGSPILSVLGKRTYRFANGSVASLDESEQIPFLEADEFWGSGNPASDAPKLESDLVAFKPMTDVVLLAKAHAPKGRPVAQLSVGVQVGAARKIIQVTGDRKVIVTGTGIQFSDPKPFEEMPLDYSLAYGGKDDKSEPGTAYVYPRNPIGRGFIVKSTPEALQNLELPNLESPEKLISPKNLVLGKFENWRMYPDPAGVGYFGKSFYPRYTMAGLPPDVHKDAEVERQRRLMAMPEIGTPGSAQPQPVMPLLNAEFFNGASPGLRLPYLRGDEAFSLANFDPEHPRFTFKLPGVAPTGWIDVGQGKVAMAMVLHTVLVYKATNQLTLTWRGCVKYGGPATMESFTAFAYGVES